MFTGLVEGQGTVGRMTSLTVGMRLSIVPDAGCFSAAEIATGDSISISGCCLTAVAIRGDALDFEAGEETLAKTNLGTLKVGSRVNLERSLPTGGRFGGHFVQGHVDGKAVVHEIIRNGEWIDMWFAAPAELLRLLVPKGSVAVDGISLTVVNLTRDRFSVALIPHTLQVTTLGSVALGDTVNLETDILGKYVDQLLEHRLADGLIKAQGTVFASPPAIEPFSREGHPPG